MHAHEEPAASAAAWLVLTPSVDQRGWEDAIRAAAHTAGWLVIPEHEAFVLNTGPRRLVVTNDADRARASGAEWIAAIVPEPESAPDAVAELHDIVAPESNWYASTLLARALALAPDYRVVTAVELSARPREVVVFDVLRLTLPASRAEIPRKPAVATAFKLYRDVASRHQEAIEWPERMFNYCPRAARDWPSWGVLDTTGRPRMLVYGPYLSLPPGRWQACIRFGVDQDAAKRQYRLDWGTRTATVSEYVTPRTAGIYELMMEFDWTEVDAAEIRLILMEGSFTGTVMFQGMTVRRIAEATASAETGVAA